MFSVVLIVKNEERLLPDAILSLGSVPEVVVCDTGSTDGTVKVANNLGVKVCHFAWCEDFSAARTFAQSHASHDWIVRFDADERMVVSESAKRSTWLRDAVAAGDTEGQAMVCIRREHQPGFVGVAVSRSRVACPAGWGTTSCCGCTRSRCDTCPGYSPAPLPLDS